jgi:hypothetical protein
MAYATNPRISVGTCRTDRPTNLESIKSLSFNRQLLEMTLERVKRLEDQSTPTVEGDKAA